jgi:hypothetical protein
MTDLVVTVLTSTAYDEVTQPVFSAVELFKTTFDQKLRPEGKAEFVPGFVFSAFDGAVEHKQHLVVKRFVFLILILCLPPLRTYIVQTSKDQHKTSKFLTWLEGDVERLFHGEYSTFGDQQIAEFVSAAIIAHASS